MHLTVTNCHGKAIERPRRWTGQNGARQAKLGPVAGTIDHIALGQKINVAALVRAFLRQREKAC